jgi:hypothetical protein
MTTHLLTMALSPRRPVLPLLLLLLLLLLPSIIHSDLRQFHLLVVLMLESSMRRPQQFSKFSPNGRRHATPALKRRSFLHVVGALETRHYILGVEAILE